MYDSSGSGHLYPRGGQGGGGGGGGTVQCQFIESRDKAGKTNHVGALLGVIMQSLKGHGEDQ